MKDKHDKVTPDFPDMEGDYIYSKERDARLFDAADKLKAFEEMDIYFTVKKFEDLLHIHGLPYLVDHMSDNGIDALLESAHVLFHNRNWSDGDE